MNDILTVTVTGGMGWVWFLLHDWVQSIIMPGLGVTSPSQRHPWQSQHSAHLQLGKGNHSKFKSCKTLARIFFSLKGGLLRKQWDKRMKKEKSTILNWIWRKHFKGIKQNFSQGTCYNALWFKKYWVYTGDGWNNWGYHKILTVKILKASPRQSDSGWSDPSVVYGVYLNYINQVKYRR